MVDGRRHSVDIPISRTLVALRRVRSLRDPSTNSMSKFSALFDNVNWETNSSNGISLRFENCCQEGKSAENGLLGSKNMAFNGHREKIFDDFELCCGSAKPKLASCENSRWEGNTDTSIRTKHDDGLDYCGENQVGKYGKKSLREKYYSDHRDKELDFTCTTPSTNSSEDVDSCNGPIVRSSQQERMGHTASKKKSQYKNHIKSAGHVGDVLSRVGSPCPSLSDALSSHSTSLFAHEEPDIADLSHRGCGLSCCWSRTPRFRETNLSSDVEDHPLLSGNIGETALSGQRNWKHANSEATPYPETPRSLSQKFRPKSFKELVGQNVVARSLLGAISKGRITSFYLFHGPRGTGKTSTSRIFAAALNCLSLDDEHRPCGRCQECVLFFSGRSRDVKEVDCVRINRKDRVRSLIKNAAIPPVSSRYKIFILDECQLLQGETWASVLNGLEDLSQRVVFVMITPDLDKLPRSAVSRSQRYHFPKIKDADIASRLGKICLEEGLDYDQAALDFIAAKSNGSLRDAETMLDQLSLLGKKIKVSLAYELIGIVSDDELLDLLDLALSSDTSNTVIRARELMRSRIDPMQLISQLANLIMDVLAGKCEEGSSEVKRSFLGRHTSEADSQKLSRALKILSETEKQLRISKNQTTWLTVALLQLSSVDPSSSYANNSELCLTKAHDRDGDFCSTSSTGESSKHLLTCSCDGNKLCKLEENGNCKGTLEFIWKKAIQLCHSKSLRNFLQKQGKLSSLFVNQGLAVAELEFNHPDHLSKAEKSWKLIASSLQSVLGCNVEIRINLVHCVPVTKYAKVKKPSFSLFSCSRRMQQKSQSTTEHGSESDYSVYNSKKPIISYKPLETCSSGCGSQMIHDFHDRTPRSGEENILCTGKSLPQVSLPDGTLSQPGLGDNSSKDKGYDQGFQDLSIHETENQPNCFSRTLKLQKKLHSSEPAQMICSSVQAENKLALSFPRKTSFDTYFSANHPYFFCSSSNNFSNNSRDEDGLREEHPDRLCWSTPTFPLRKVWQQRHQQQRCHLMGWVLPCTKAK